MENSKESLQTDVRALRVNTAEDGWDQIVYKSMLRKL